MNQSICRQLCAWLLMLAGATYLAMQLTACNTVQARTSNPPVHTFGAKPRNTGTTSTTTTELRRDAMPRHSTQHPSLEAYS